MPSISVYMLCEKVASLYKSTVQANIAILMVLNYILIMFVLIVFLWEGGSLEQGDKNLFVWISCTYNGKIFMRT